MDLINLPDLRESRGVDVTKSNPSFINLDSILDTYRPFPDYSTVLGLCTDSFPFMLGLDNPRSGSVLIAGYNKHGLTQMFRTVISSACRINDPEKVSYVLITSNPENYLDISDFPHCQGLLSPYDKISGETVIELASVSEQRKYGRELGSTIILVIDGFQDFSTMLSDYSVYLNLRSLITSGPKSKIWPFISVSENPSKKDLLLDFGTYIMQHPEEENLYTFQTQRGCIEFQNLSA